MNMTANLAAEVKDIMEQSWFTNWRTSTLISLLHSLKFLTDQEVRIAVAAR